MTTTQKVLLGVGAGFALSCCGLVGVLATYGFGVYRGEVCDHLGTFEEVTSRLGTPVTCAHELLATGEIDDDNTFAFTLTGPKGSGRAYVQSHSEGSGEVYQGILVVIDGQEYVVAGKRPPVKLK